MRACVYDMIRSVFFLLLGVVQRRAWKAQSLARVWCELGKGRGRRVRPAVSLWVSEALTSAASLSLGRHPSQGWSLPRDGKQLASDHTFHVHTRQCRAPRPANGAVTLRATRHPPPAPAQGPDQQRSPRAPEPADPVRAGLFSARSPCLPPETTAEGLPPGLLRLLPSAF